MELWSILCPVLRRLIKLLFNNLKDIILTTAPWKNPSAWADKISWVTKYFDCIFHKKVIMTHHKEFMDDGSAILIDDRTAHGADSFGDRLIQFGTNAFPDWESVLLRLIG